MLSCYQKRGVSSGFSLLEILIVLALIGIISSLLIPKLMEAKQEALRQTTRQQAKLIERALGDWFMAQSSIAAAAIAWENTYDTNSDGYADPSLMVNQLRPYLLNQGGDSSSIIGSLNFTSQAIYSEQMQQIEGDNFIGNMTEAEDLDHAHVRLFWEKDNTDTDDKNERTQSSPKIVLFLPST